MAVVWCNRGDCGVVQEGCGARGVVPQGCGATSATTIGEHRVDFTEAGRHVSLQCVHNKVIRLGLTFLRVILSQRVSVIAARHMQ